MMEEQVLREQIAEMLDKADVVDYAIQLPDTEYDVMCAVWAGELPVTTGYLMQVLGNDRNWKTPTLISFLQRLEERGFIEDIAKFELCPIEINTLNIERTFIDKIMSVKRHAICGTLDRKVRHIYDVVRLYQMPEIQTFLAETEELKRLVQLSKDTDSFYIGRRNISAEYDPTGPYNFPAWQNHFDAGIRSTYETLHQTLLYTDEKQDFDAALTTFQKISELLSAIDE